MDKKSFVLTGYVERSTCSCGCISNNNFWQDGGVSGSPHLASLHKDIEKHLDELSQAKLYERGRPCDIKVTVTIEQLKEHEHRILNRRSFSGLGYTDNGELQKEITTPAVADQAVELKGADQHHSALELEAAVKALHKEVSVDYLQDMHDRLLLIRRTGNLDKLQELQESLERLLQT